MIFELLEKYNKWVPKNFYFLIQIWYMKQYMGFWYTFGTCLEFKKRPRNMTVTENVWSGFTYSSFCAVYKSKLVYGLLKGIFHYTSGMVNIREATRNDFFDWYIALQYTYYNDLFCSTYAVNNGRKVKAMTMAHIICIFAMVFRKAS